MEFYLRDLPYAVSMCFSCIFVSSNCAFFVNYLISASTIGIGFDILRIADLVLYSLLWTLAKSQAERPMIRAVSGISCNTKISQRRKLNNREIIWDIISPA